MEIDKSSHLGNTEQEIDLSEFELQLWHIHYAFCCWMEECEKLANQMELSADEIVVLHILRMRDRPKTIAELGRILGRDNFFNINYCINKLLKLDLIEKIEQATKKQHLYGLTEKGKKDTDHYVKTRSGILINTLMKEAGPLNLKEIVVTMGKLKTLYQEAIKISGFYQPPDHITKEEKNNSEKE